MKTQVLLSFVLMTSCQLVYAEPVFMPQAASVLKAKQAETGIGGEYGYQRSEIVGNSGTTYINKVWQVPVFARYGITDDAEAKLSIPYTSAVDSSEGLSSTRHADSGIGNIQVGAKWNFLKKEIPVAAALDLDLPTANPSNNPGSLGNRYSTQIQQGFNAHLQLVADSPRVADLVTGHASIGYMNTATYTNANQVRFNPSDLFTFGASVDLSLKRFAEGLSMAGEMVGNSGLTHSRSNSMVNGTDLGTVLEVGPTVRYQTGPVRTYAGFLVDEGKAAFRAYNYRLSFGASLLWGGH